MSTVVKLISGSEELMLDPCDGQRTIAQATDVFSCIDPDFRKWGTDVAEEATPKTPVAVHEIIENAKLAKMFKSLNGDVSKLILTQDQILNFVTKYRSWLRKDGWATFFLFRAADELFVALVHILSDSKLETNLYRFEDNYVWSAIRQHRLVIPKL